ncbi:MAG: hypothetical protein FWG61_04140 [Firmicutes bacterium]|nr:hypothetical protein [Bacillota bacterium]
MTCRCNEIQKCEQEIRRLEKDLAEAINAAQAHSSQGAAIIPAFAQDLTSAVYIANITRIDMRLTALRRIQEKYIQNCLDKRKAELQRLRSRQIIFENEDRRFHEMINAKP